MTGIEKAMIQENEKMCPACGWEGPEFEFLSVSPPPKIIHTTEEDFQHFLSYTGQHDHGNLSALRVAYYAGANVMPPSKEEFRDELPKSETLQALDTLFANTPAFPAIRK